MFFVSPPPQRTGQYVRNTANAVMITDLSSFNTDLVTVSITPKFDNSRFVIRVSNHAYNGLSGGVGETYYAIYKNGALYNNIGWRAIQNVSTVNVGFGIDFECDDANLPRGVPVTYSLRAHMNGLGTFRQGMGPTVISVEEIPQ